ncbi:MAG: NUDIX hydrolase [Candidatus Amesbacteria bacterium GW2011_GWC1_47_15]|uniref:Oxidized purine nucleoside triphosphate hydrolase n=1 Tax=Candidatus Amesbacteria bacterium GW2011_GWC1_47_15 TaxID=1618364 RepID=A0A0G1UZI9_9BACT|nr:MAG: NUDIX hydrolase [Candidatus Amesbacteria bacterium GW2011_GWC1_47_15]
MNLAEMISTRAQDLQLATWCIPLRGKEEVLLAMKKRGFGAGFWNASGGKIKPGEEPAFAAAREALEELGIAVSNLLPVAKIEFYFVNKPEWGQRVIGYTTREWSGEPEETEEMSPKWFNYEEVPYGQMWADDRIWLPMVLAGKKVEGEFLFGDDNNILEYNLREVMELTESSKV